MSTNNKNKALPAWDRAFLVEEGGYTHDDYEDVDLTVDLDPITITASLPKLSSRADYRMLERYAKAYRRGKINREQIPFKYRIHLANTQDEQQQRAYEMFAEEKAAKELSNELGWDKLEKAYGLGMSTAVAAPTMASIAGDALTGETAKAVYHTAKKAGKRVAQDAKEIWDMTKGLTKQQVGNFLLSMTGASLLGMEGNEYAQSKGYASFEDMMHESWFGGDPLSNSFKGDLARFGYGFLRPDVALGGYFGTTGANLAKVFLKGVPDPAEKLMQQGAGKLFKQSLETFPKEQSKVGQALARARQGISDWTQKVQDATRKKIDKISQQEWVDYFRPDSPSRLREEARRMKELEGRIDARGQLLHSQASSMESSIHAGSHYLGFEPYTTTTYRPFHSNNVEFMKKAFQWDHKMQDAIITRISDTEIKITLPESARRGAAQTVTYFDPALSLPEGVTLPRKVVSHGASDELSFILKYPSKGASKPTITVAPGVRKSLLVDAEVGYWQMPQELKMAIKREMDTTREIIGGFTKTGEPDPRAKTFGSSLSATEDILPHISDDIDYIVSEDFYNQNIRGKVPLHPEQKTRDGHTHQYSYEGEGGKKLDVVIIRNGIDGKAVPSPIALQLFAKVDPMAYNDMLTRRATSPRHPNYTIPFSADELVAKYDPVVGNIIDAFTAQASPQKLKHLGRTYVMLERAPVDKLEKALHTIGRMKYAYGYTPLDTSTFDFTDIERNINFLQKIGFIAENPKKLASDPKRMALIMEEYNQFMSGLYRGERLYAEDMQAWHAMNVQQKLENFMTRATEWTGLGGNARGTGKNYEYPGNSGYGPLYSARQVDINKYFSGKGQKYYPDDLASFYESLNPINMPQEMRSKIVNIVRSLAAKAGTNVSYAEESDLHNIITTVFHLLDPDAKQQLLKELDDVVPYLVGDICAGQKYRGAFLPKKSGAYYLQAESYPFEIVQSSEARYNPVRLKAASNPNTASEQLQDIVKTSYRPTKELIAFKKEIASIRHKEGLMKDRASRLREERWELELRSQKIKRTQDMLEYIGIGMATPPAIIGAVGLLTLLFGTITGHSPKEIKEGLKRQLLHSGDVKDRVRARTDVNSTEKTDTKSEEGNEE